MRCRVRSLAWLIGLLLVTSQVAAAGEKVSIESLLKEMTTRDTLARTPAPAYTCAQASSYDRDSVSPDNHKAWMANMDRSQYVRIDEVDGKKEYVLMDEEGPGAIVRFWATWHGPRGKPFSNGTLRVYLDGSDTPAIEGSIQEVLDQGLLTGPPLSQSVSPLTNYRQRGHNLYLPIPYANGCKVTYSTDVHMDRGAHTGEALYYQINYRSYAEGTEVESFSMQRLKDAREVLDATQATLSEKKLAKPSLDGGTLAYKSGTTIEPGKEQMIGSITGSQAIRYLTIKVDAEDRSQALRSTILKIEFDGEPCVWTPVGEFFGVGYQPKATKTWYTQVTEDGKMSCAWTMPFEKSAKVSVVNLGDEKVVVSDFSAYSNDWKWDERSMHFHSTWFELNKVSTRKESDRPGAGSYDVNYVTVEGEGVYVGDTLTIFNGAASWWGEGDEKIFVDGEDFPSHFGTGTEDYYGYAWCLPAKFSAPFHSQPEGDGNLAGGFSVNNRYRALDAIPFSKSIKFDMENWHWADTLVNYAPTTFFYARPGATKSVKPDPEAAAREITRSRSELGTVHVVEGAIEGEDLEITSVSGGETEKQVIGRWGWSNESQLWWVDPSKGDELVLEFPAEKAGEQNVKLQLTKAVDYAIVEFSINGKKVKGTFDRYNDEVATDMVDLGKHDLKQGGNTLKVRIAGKNDKAVPRHMFGLDYIKLD